MNDFFSGSYLEFTTGKPMLLSEVSKNFWGISMSIDEFNTDNPPSNLLVALAGLFKLLFRTIDFDIMLELVYSALRIYEKSRLELLWLLIYVD
jgi:hypothetical protein